MVVTTAPPRAAEQPYGAGSAGPAPPPAVLATPRRGAFWQHVVLTRVALARDDVRRCREYRAGEPGLEQGLEQVEELLRTAEQAALGPPSRVLHWLTGSGINRAFTSLHAAQVLLARHSPDDGLEGRLLSALARLRATMPLTEARRRVLEEHFEATATATTAGTTAGTTATAVSDAAATGASTPGHGERNGGGGPDGADGTGPSAPRVPRWVLEKALEWSYAASDAQYARLRSFRNIIVAMSVALLVLAVGLAVMGMVWPDSLQFCFGSDPAKQVCPTGARATWRDALLIEVLGATGGAMAAVLAIRNIQGTSTPYSVPFALAMLKLPLGAVVALVGLLLIHGRFIPGLTDLDTSGQILAYAVVLGVAQQAVTAMVDRRGQELLEKIPSKRAHGPGRVAAAREQGAAAR
jgi:hypothetical protein